MSVPAGSRTAFRCSRTGPAGRFLALLLLVPGAVLAQVPDDRYRPDPNGHVNAVLVQPDGRVLVGGNFTQIGGLARSRLVRLHHDGSVDTSFANIAINQAVHAIVRRSNGKVVIAGAFTQVGGQNRHFIAQLNDNGSLDAGFVPPQPNDWVFALALQPDGRLIAGGQFAQVNGQPRTALIRLAVDGSLDSAFNPVLNGMVEALAMQSDGRILFGGQFTQVSGQPRGYFARLNADGVLDRSFVADANGGVSALLLQMDDSVVLAGSFGQVAGQSRLRLARVDTKGRLDPTFTPAVTSGFPLALAEQRDGRILVAGNFNQINGAARVGLVRLGRNGVPASSADFFAQTGAAAVRTIAELPTGQVVFGGSLLQVNGEARSHLARVERDGQLPRSSPATDLENATSSFGEQAYTFMELPDETVVVGGNFARMNGVTRNGLLKLNRRGLLVSGFTPSVSHHVGGGGSTIVPGTPMSLAALANGRIVVGGSFQYFGMGEVPRSQILRLTATGALDTSFTASATPCCLGVNGLFPLDNSLLLVAGGFTGLSGQSRPRLGRLQGSAVDFSFPFLNVDDTVRTLTVDRTGRILIGGQFAHIGNNARPRIARLHQVGAVDAGFAPSVGPAHFGLVNAIAVRANDSIVIGGNFGNVAGNTAHARLASLTDGGLLDPTFTPQVSSEVASIVPWADGRLLIAGAFTQVGGATRQRLALLHPDGSLDTSFPNHAVADLVHNIHVQSNGVLLIGGRFSLIAGEQRWGLARIALKQPPRDSFTHLLSSVIWSQGGSMPLVVVPPVLSISTDDGASWTELGPMTRLGSNWRRSGVTQPRDQHYLLRIQALLTHSTGSVSRIERRTMLYHRDRLFDDGFQP